MLRPNLLLVRYTLLSVPETGISSHLRIYRTNIIIIIIIMETPNFIS